MQEREISYWIPSIEEMQGFLRIVDGICYSDFEEMCLDNTENINEWVAQRLSADCQALALRIREEWQGIINLESITCSEMELFLNWHGENWIKNDIVCLTIVDNDIIQLTEDGRRFRDNNEEIISKIDEFEGMLFILGAIAASESCSLGEILADFERFYSRYGDDPYYEIEKGLDSHLPDRLKYLVKRRLIHEYDSMYQATEAGREYLLRCRQSASPNSSTALLDEMKDIFVRRQLAVNLPKTHHKKFEQLIKQLLKKMGYKNVTVTGGPGDGGVDVFADLEVGITSVRLVIQAKQQQANVGIDVVDRLRGSLHRGGSVHQTIGTIVTTANFTRSARDAAVGEGAAPIKLIDGEALLDLLVKHGIRIRKL